MTVEQWPERMLPHCPEENYQEIFYLRVRLNKKIKDWNGPAVTKLLGYTNSNDLKPKHLRVLRMLDGPHGYAVYKALCLKQGLTELVDTCADT